MKPALKILYISPEIYPFVKTTDLADIGGALPKFIKNMGHDIRVMMPNYKTINERKYVLRDVIRLQGLKIRLGEEELSANGKSAFLPDSKVQIYFLDNKKIFDRVVDYVDAESESQCEEQARRFLFFAIGCLQTLKLLHWQPDVVHCNDWQTALIPFLLKVVYKNDAFFKDVRTLFSIHNTLFPGKLKPSTLKMAGVSDELCEELNKNRQLSFLQLGVKYADLVNSGSHSQTLGLEKSSDFPDFAKILKEQEKSFIGIDYGIDSHAWNPQTDKLLVKNYSYENTEGRAENKKELLEKFELEVDGSAPIVATNIDDNPKAKKFFFEMIDKLLLLDIKLIVLGYAAQKIHDELQKLKEKYPKKVALQLAVDLRLIHLIGAGSDMFLSLPYSRFRLSQLYGMAYGAIPIIYKDDIIRDSISNFNTADNKGNGFLLEKATPSELINIFKKAIKLFSDKDVWQKLIENAMNNDFSWDGPAQEYVKLYQKLTGLKTVKK